MKNFKNYIIFNCLLVCTICFTSCVQDDDFDIPPINAEEPDITPNSTVQLVKNVYRGFEPLEIAPNATEAVYIEAYVISNDEPGNFYKQLVIQDAPENPSAGIAISTEATDLYTRFEPGRKIYFRVDGLYSGEFAGLPTVGTQNGAEVGRIAIEDFYDRIFRSLETVELVPTIVTIPEVLNNEMFLNTLVQLENVQFEEDVLGLAYANVNNTYGVNRTLEDCNENEISLRTSGFADFKDLALPLGNGDVIAVVSIFNTTYQLFIRDPNDVNFMGLRCE